VAAWSWTVNPWPVSAASRSTVVQPVRYGSPLAATVRATRRAVDERVWPVTTSGSM
jgi:hypothetical protein